MMQNLFPSSYALWATRLARSLLAVQFGVAAYFKLTAFSMMVTQTASVGVPFPTLAVALALILEIIGIASLISGKFLRILGLLLAAYVMLLAVIFYHNWSDQLTFGLFVSHLGLTAALLYVSAYGTEHA